MLNKHPPEYPFRTVIRHQLSAVVFIRDYIQFYFEGPILTTYTYPVIHDGTTWRWGLFGYCDRLCACINHVVTEARVIEDQDIRIVFDDATHITISLLPDDYCGPEAAVLTNDPNPEWWVW